MTCSEPSRSLLRPHDPHIALLASCPVPVCRFARAKRSRLCGGEAACGHAAGGRPPCEGGRCHLRLAWPGVRAGVSVGLALAPADGSEPEVAVALAADPTGHLSGDLSGDRNSWAPLLAEAVTADGVCLLAPDRQASQDPTPQRSQSLSRSRDRLEPVCGQLVER